MAHTTPLKSQPPPPPKSPPPPPKSPPPTPPKWETAPGSQATSTTDGDPADAAPIENTEPWPGPELEVESPERDRSQPLHIDGHYPQPALPFEGFPQQSASAVGIGAASCTSNVEKDDDFLVPFGSHQNSAAALPLSPVAPSSGNVEEGADQHVFVQEGSNGDVQESVGDAGLGVEAAKPIYPSAALHAFEDPEIELSAGTVDARSEEARETASPQEVGLDLKVMDDEKEEVKMFDTEVSVVEEDADQLATIEDNDLAGLSTPGQQVLNSSLAIEDGSLDSLLQIASEAEAEGPESSPHDGLLGVPAVYLSPLAYHALDVTPGDGNSKDDQCTGYPNEHEQVAQNPGNTGHTVPHEVEDDTSDDSSDEDLYFGARERSVRANANLRRFQNRQTLGLGTRAAAVKALIQYRMLRRQLESSRLYQL